MPDYRSGIGPDGDVDAHALTLLPQRPLGVATRGQPAAGRGRVRAGEPGRRPDQRAAHRAHPGPGGVAARLRGLRAGFRRDRARPARSSLPDGDRAHRVSSPWPAPAVPRSAAADHRRPARRPGRGAGPRGCRPGSELRPDRLPGRASTSWPTRTGSFADVQAAVRQALRDRLVGRPAVVRAAGDSRRGASAAAQEVPGVVAARLTELQLATTGDRASTPATTRRTPTAPAEAAPADPVPADPDRVSTAGRCSPVHARDRRPAGPAVTVSPPTPPSGPSTTCCPSSTGSATPSAACSSRRCSRWSRQSWRGSRDDVDGLYDDWFIETCAEWVRAVHR